jgi:Na+-driven multidrug efflux pump
MSIPGEHPSRQKPERVTAGVKGGCGTNKVHIESLIVEAADYQDGGSSARPKTVMPKPIRSLLKFAAGTTLINIMTGFSALARGKLAAILLGTAGVGVFGQVDSFYRGLVQICILSTGTGVIRCVAELKGTGNDPAIRRAFWSITTFSLILSMAAAAIVLLSSSTLSRLVLGSSGYGMFLSVVAFGLPLQAVSDIIMGMLVGLRDLRGQLRVTAAYTGGGVLLYALLIYRYGLLGAIYSSLGIVAVTCFFSIVAVRNLPGVSLWPKSGERLFDVRLLRSILAISIMGGIMAITDRGMLVVFRSILVTRFGLEANGLYQPVYSLSQLTIAMAFGFISAYMIPTLSGALSVERMRVEFSAALRLALLIATFFSATTVIFGRLILIATYSSAFLGATQLLRFQALGDFFRALMLVLSGTIFAVHGWRPWFAIGMSYCAAYMLFFALLLPILGFPAISVAYLLAYAVSCGLALVLLPRYAMMPFPVEHRPLLFRSMGLLVIGFLLASLTTPLTTYLIGTAALLFWARLAFSGPEYRRAWMYVRNEAVSFVSGG